MPDIKLTLSLDDFVWVLLVDVEKLSWDHVGAVTHEVSGEIDGGFEKLLVLRLDHASEL